MEVAAVAQLLLEDSFPIERLLAVVAIERLLVVVEEFLPEDSFAMERLNVVLLSTLQQRLRQQMRMLIWLLLLAGLALQWL